MAGQRTIPGDHSISDRGIVISARRDLPRVGCDETRVPYIRTSDPKGAARGTNTSLLLDGYFYLVIPPTCLGRTRNVRHLVVFILGIQEIL